MNTYVETFQTPLIHGKDRYGWLNVSLSLKFNESGELHDWDIYEINLGRDLTMHKFADFMYWFDDTIEEFIRPIVEAKTMEFEEDERMRRYDAKMTQIKIKQTQIFLDNYGR